MLYYLATAPPPSTAAYLLKAFDLTNQVSKTLIGTPFAAQSIAFDHQRKLIIVATTNDPNTGGSSGDLGAINFFDLQGNAKGTFTMADRPEKIVVMH